MSLKNLIPYFWVPFKWKHYIPDTIPKSSDKSPFATESPSSDSSSIISSPEIPLSPIPYPVSKPKFSLKISTDSFSRKPSSKLSIHERLRNGEFYQPLAEPSTRSNDTTLLPAFEPASKPKLGLKISIDSFSRKSSGKLSIHERLRNGEFYQPLAEHSTVSSSSTMPSSEESESSITATTRKLTDVEDDDFAPQWTADIEGHTTVRFQTVKQRNLMMSLPLHNLKDHELLLGNPNEIGALRNSPFGKFLNKNKYQIIETFKNDGANSYCFKIEDESNYLKFLKIIKLSSWDIYSLRNFIYLEERGIGWVMANKENLSHVLIPDMLIGVDKDGNLTSNPDQIKLLLATVSPMLKGKNLSRLLKTEKLSEKDIMKLSLNMLQAVISFNSKGFKHRDLNPQNFFVNPDTLDITIIDFDEGTTSSQFTLLEGPYAAPESSDKMDEFTLGLVLLEMFTGLKPKDPSKGSKQETIRDQILNGEIQPLLFALPSGLQILSPIIEGLLKVDSNQRWDIKHTLAVFEEVSTLDKNTTP